MSKKLMIYNLNFRLAEDFKTFDVNGYIFYPIPKKQLLRRNIYTSDDALKENREMSLNAFVEIPHVQPDSILYKGGIYSERRKRKLLDDILVIISCCIGRNVVAKFMRVFPGFPTASGKHCEMVAKNSEYLKTYLEIALRHLSAPIWQTTYEDGFHLKMFYNASNIYVIEPRFLADITIWEYLYYRENTHFTYRQLNSVTLNTKIKYLISKFLLNTEAVFPEERFRIFSDLRNQLSHSGKLPIKNPNSLFNNLGWIGCENYLKLFNRLTQALVLKTLGIESLDHMSAFSVRTFLEELTRESRVRLFEEMDRRRIEF